MGCCRILFSDSPRTAAVSLRAKGGTAGRIQCFLVYHVSRLPDTGIAALYGTGAFRESDLPMVAVIADRYYRQCVFVRDDHFTHTQPSEKERLLRIGSRFML